MPSQYQDLVELGHELAHREESEAALRTAVVRFYYGTLWLVRQLFLPNPSRRNAHQQAAAELGKRTRSATLHQYNDLLELRGLADYHPEEDGWDQKVLRARRLHEHIVEELRKRGHLPRR